jgi:hypothetical protein
MHAARSADGLHLLLLHLVGVSGDQEHASHSHGDPDHTANVKHQRHPIRHLFVVVQGFISACHINGFYHVIRVHDGCGDEARDEGSEANAAEDDPSDHASFVREPFPGANEGSVIAEATSSIEEHAIVESEMGEVDGSG